MALTLPVPLFPAARHLSRLAPLLPALATVLLLAAPLDPGDVTAAGKVTPADAASAVLVLTCAFRLLRDGRRVLTPAAAVVLGAPLIGFAAAAATSLDPAAGLTGFLRYAQVFVLVPAALALLLRDRWDFAVVAGSVVLLALVQGGVGVWQYATGTGALYRGETIRAVGTFGPSDVMGMATVVAYGLVIAVGYALAPGQAGGTGRAGQASRASRAGRTGGTGLTGRAGQAGQPPWVRPAALVCAAALVVPLTLSFSRGTWIATAATCAAMILTAGRHLAVRVFAALAACAVLLVGGFGVGSELIGERAASITHVTDAPDRSVTDRYALWSAALSMWREHPVTGVGLKRFPAERDSHASLALSSAGDTGGAGRSPTREPLLSPHNMYLLALSEQGLLGCALLTGSWAALLTAAALRLRGGRRTGAGPAAAGLLLWTCVDFLYADIGGPSTVLTAVVLGLGAWWALNPSPPHGGRAR